MLEENVSTAKDMKEVLSHQDELPTASEDLSASEVGVEAVVPNVTRTSMVEIGRVLDKVPVTAVMPMVKDESAPFSNSFNRITYRRLSS